MALYEIIPTNMQGSGFFFKGRAGENMLRGKLVYKAANGAWYLADADLAAETPALGLTMGRANQGQIVRVLKEGYIGRSDWAWVVGGEIYTSGVPGELTQVAAGLVQVVGMATRSDMISFDPEGSVGAGGVVCALLEGATAYVGFDVCKGTNYANYWTCDGVADDVQIQAAIAYTIGLGGGHIMLESGDYQITAIIAIDGQNLYDIIFSGNRDTVLTLANGAATGVMNVIRCPFVLIENIEIDGARGVYVQSTVGITIAGNGQAVVRGVTIHDMIQTGIGTSDFGGTPNGIVDIQDSEIYDIGGGAFSPQAILVGGNESFVCRGSTLHDIDAQDDNTNGQVFNVYDSEHNLMEGNWIYSAHSYALDVKSFAIASDTETFTVFRDNYVSDVPSAASVLVGCVALAQRADILDNRFVMTKAASTTVIVNTGSDNSVIKNNVLDGGAQATFLIRIRGTSANIVVKNNEFKDSASRGVSLEDTSQNCVVVHNAFADMVLWAIQEIGAGGPSIFYGNDLTGVANKILLTDANHRIPKVFAPVSDPNAALGRHPVVDMPNATDTNVYAQIPVPLDYQALVSAQVIVVSAATGNMVWTVDTDFGKLCSSESYTEHSDSDGDTDALTIDDLECIDISAALTAIAAGDLVGVDFMRDGDNVADTIEDSVYYLGIRMRYV